MVKNIIQSIKSVLFRDPWELFEEEKKFIKESFYFPGTNRKGIILVHGWSSTAYEVRRLGEFLNENGYTVSGPMLRGHGTRPEDLENIKWEDWLSDLEKTYEEMQGKVDKVYLGGTSIGACLISLLARKKKNISGLILMAMPFKIRFEKFLILLAKLTVNIKPFNKKYYPPTFGAATTITRLISYQKYSVKSALETFELVETARKDLEKVAQPAFLIQSKSDHIVTSRSLEEIYKRLGSKIKEKKYIKRAYHTFISDIKNEYVFEDILNFLNEN